MRDWIAIGNAPFEEENLADLDEPDYHERAKKECEAFIAQLRRELGEEPPGAKLVVAKNPHDFGTYLDVRCYYETTDKKAAEYAFQCESDGPAFWDEKAKADLGLI